MLLFPISFGRSCYNSSHFPHLSAVLMWVLYLEAFSDFCRQKSHCYRWVEGPGSSPSPLSGAPDLQQHKSSRFSQGCLLVLVSSVFLLVFCGPCRVSTSCEDSRLTCRRPLFIYLPWPRASSHPVWGCGDQSPHSQAACPRLFPLLCFPRRYPVCYVC